jgi:hypothetical protein
MQRLHVKNVLASNRWLELLRTRNNINFQSPSEAATVNLEAATKLQNVLSECHPLK